MSENSCIKNIRMFALNRMIYVKLSRNIVCRRKVDLINKIYIEVKCTLKITFL